MSPDRGPPSPGANGTAKVIGEWLHQSRGALQELEAGLEILRLECSGSTGALEIIQGVQEARTRLRRSFEELEELFEVHSFRKRPVDLRRCWQHAWKVLEVSLELTESSGEKIPEVEADPEAMILAFRHIFTALLGNSPGAREVEISWISTGQDDHPAIHLEITATHETPPTVHGSTPAIHLAARNVHAHGGKIGLRRDPPSLIVTVVLPAG